MQKRITSNLKGSLLKRLPKKYHERVGSIEEEGGLIDDCKYIITTAEGWYFERFENLDSIPVRSITEAIRYFKNSEKGE